MHSIPKIQIFLIIIIMETPLELGLKTIFIPQTNIYTLAAIKTLKLLNGLRKFSHTTPWVNTGFSA